MQGVPCIPDSHPYRITNTKCRINTVVSSDDGHIVARNIYRKEINVLRRIVYQVGLFTRLYRDAQATKRKIYSTSVKYKKLKNYILKASSFVSGFAASSTGLIQE
jgi:hypothetical protein